MNISKRKQKIPMKPIVILYHADCSDGFGAAWAARKKFGNKASYIPVRHQTPPPEGLMGKEIYMLDYTYPEKEIRALMRKNKRVTAIDHHISAKKTTLMTHDPLFALEHSGAVLSWMYFHPKKKTPKLLRYIEDQDLWNFRMAHTTKVARCISMNPFDFGVWSKIARDLENQKKERQYIRDGGLLLAYQDQHVAKGADRAVPVRFEGYSTYAANSPFFDSQIGHTLYEKLPPIAIIWSVRPEGIKVSLRSDGTVDVSKIAGKYGGGGHKAAAGFLLPPNAKLPWKRITIPRDKRASG